MSAAELPLGPGPLVPEGAAAASRGLDGLFEVAPTPGPWHTDGDVVWAGIGAPGICMTVEPPVGVHFVERPEAERHANARLIAASPKLLSLLRELIAAGDACVLAGQDEREWRIADARRKAVRREALVTIDAVEGRS